MSHLNAQTLSEWVTIATSGLPMSLQIRLKNEIEDHYASLLEKQLGEGQSQAQAETSALQQLGAADDVAKSYRDAHFSRGRYSKTMWIVTALLIIQTITFIGRGTWSVLEHFYGGEDRLSFEVTYFQPWNIVASFLSIVLIVMIGRSVLVLWRERYDIRVSGVIFWLFVLGVSGSIGVVIFYSAFYSIIWYMQLGAVYDSPIWQGAVSVVGTIGNLSPVILGIALLAFVFTSWKAVYASRDFFAQVFTLMTGGIGVVIFLNIIVNSTIMPLAGYYGARFHLLIVEPMLIGLFAFFLTLPLVTFRTMSLSGQTLEAGE